MARGTAATWVTKRLGSILLRSTSREPGWPASTFTQRGWECSTFNRGFRARLVAYREKRPGPKTAKLSGLEIHQPSAALKLDRQRHLARPESPVPTDLPE